MMSKPKRVGIIAEDNSDVEAAKILIRRISGISNIGVRKFVGHGCGRINKKSNAWANILSKKKCQCLILIHDLDRKNLNTLYSDINRSLAPSPIKPYLICIPVEEMEAWWLSDPSAIKKAMNLRAFPKVQGHPDTIESPKEHISKLVRRVTKKKSFINTVHNEKIAQHLNISKALNCSSFSQFHQFVTQHLT
jgi:hypothetical protein